MGIQLNAYIYRIGQVDGDMTQWVFTRHSILSQANIQSVLRDSYKIQYFFKRKNSFFLKNLDF